MSGRARQTDRQTDKFAILLYRDKISGNSLYILNSILLGKARVTNLGDINPVTLIKLNIGMLGIATSKFIFAYIINDILYYPRGRIRRKSVSSMIQREREIIPSETCGPKKERENAAARDFVDNLFFPTPAAWTTYLQARVQCLTLHNSSVPHFKCT